VAARFPGPEESTLRNELFAQLDRAIAELSAEDRTILFLRYYEDLSYREIAEITGTPEGTVKYRVHEIKRMIKPVAEQYV
jgi:RNA polymerase sigma-70 factor (ECF subfamily)